MSEDKNKDRVIEGHSYDGITEYDNPMPGWWLLTFYFTIIFAFLYWIHFDLTGSGMTPTQELNRDLAQYNAQQESAPKKELTSEVLAGMISDPNLLKAGHGVFVARCAVCHGAELGGVIGPNLTDAYWLHGKGNASDILTVVKNGVPEKGMPPWGTTLTDDEAVGVVAYILSKKDSHPKDVKAPQGEFIK